MEKAIWNGKEIVAFDISKKYEFEKAIRKASGRKELLCPDEYCTHRVLRYCHGEKKEAYFAHINNSDCAYEKYDKETSEVTKEIKRKLYYHFLEKGYETSMDEKLIDGHYTHLVLRKGKELYALQIISKFSSANRIDDFFTKYKKAAIPVFWIVTDTGEYKKINETEMHYAKRFSINESTDNSIVAVDLSGENVTLYRMDNNDYQFDNYLTYSNKYPKTLSIEYPLSKLELIGANLSVKEFETAFEEYKKTRYKYSIIFEDELEQQRKEYEAYQIQIEKERKEKLRKAKELEQRRIALEKREREEALRLAEEEKEKKRECLKSLTLGYRIGDSVEHTRFGRGTVDDIMGNLITINFQRRGLKKLSLNAEKDRLNKIK